MALQINNDFKQKQGGSRDYELAFWITREMPSRARGRVSALP